MTAPPRIRTPNKPLLACLLAFLFSAGSAAAQGTATPELILLPAAGQVAVGGLVQVRLDIQDAVDLNAFDVKLSYDPAVLEVQDASGSEPGIQVAPGDFLAPDFVLYNTVDPAAGTIRFTMTQIAPSSPQSGDGTLLVITFKGLAAVQNSPVTFLAGLIAKADGAESQPDLTPTALTVTGQGGAPPSPTPTRTAAPPAPTATLPSAPGGADPTQTAPASPAPTATGIQPPAGVNTASPAENPVETASGSGNDSGGAVEVPSAAALSQDPGTPTAPVKQPENPGALEPGGNAAQTAGIGVVVLILLAASLYLFLKRRN